MKVDFRTRFVGDVAVVDVVGNWDLASRKDLFRDVIVPLIDKRYNKFVLNLSQLTYIDSSGLGSLVSSLTRARANAGDLVATSPTNKFRDLMAITRLDKLLAIYPTEEEAVASFSKGPAASAVSSTT